MLTFCSYWKCYYPYSLSFHAIFQGGSVIRLFHKELEAYLVAEGLFDDSVTEDGKCRS